MTKINKNCERIFKKLSKIHKNHQKSSKFSKILNFCLIFRWYPSVDPHRSIERIPTNILAELIIDLIVLTADQFLATITVLLLLRCKRCQFGDLFNIYFSYLLENALTGLTSCKFIFAEITRLLSIYNRHFSDLLNITFSNNIQTSR